MSEFIFKTLVGNTRQERSVALVKSTNTKTQEESFSLTQHDGNDYAKSFHFDSPQEAQAFFKAAVEALDGYVE